MVSAMGGAEKVRRLCVEALAGTDNDRRWALSLAGRLAHRPGATQQDQRLLADALRTTARRTTSANVRNWCLTRALDLDGSIDMSRLRTHRFGRRQVARWSLEAAVSVLRVLVKPDRLTGVDLHLAVVLDGERTGIHFRNHIACPTEGVDAEAVLTGPRDVWNQILTGSSDVRNAVDSGDLSIEGDTARVFQALAAIDHPGFE
jgi:alkyl sulfatase BDS1-like metallo-beta-lactamase superfamily hydrolase